MVLPFRATFAPWVTPIEWSLMIARGTPQVGFVGLLAPIYPQFLWVSLAGWDIALVDFMFVMVPG